MGVNAESWTVQGRRPPGVDICQSGTQCLLTLGNRNLLDFIWMETDARGLAHVVYADDSRGAIRTVHAEQVAGPTTLH